MVTIKLGPSLRTTVINEGDDVYFECEIKANPKAYKLSWFKDSKELHHNASANVIVPGGHSLVLQSVSRVSTGEYTCMAANEEGKATSRPVQLDVMCEFVRDLKKTFMKLNSCKLNFQWRPLELFYIFNVSLI